MKLPVGYVPGVGVKKASGYGGFGQKMLEKMGWKNGDGLGRSRQGMTEAVDVKKKEDNAGVGANAGWDWSLKQWEAAYNSAVQAVQAHDSDSSSSSDSEVSSDDDEPALDGLIHRDGTAAATSKEELALAFELAKDNPWGRFGGRDGKMARIRRQEQIQANQARSLLGLKAPSTAAAAARPGSTTGVHGIAAVQPGSTAGLGASTSGHGDSTAQTAGGASGRVAVKSKTLAAATAVGSVDSDEAQQGGKNKEKKKKKKGSKRKLDSDQEDGRVVEKTIEQEAGSSAAAAAVDSDRAQGGGKGKEEKKKKKGSKRKLDSEQEDGRVVDKAEEQEAGAQAVDKPKKKKKKKAGDDKEQQQQKQEQEQELGGRGQQQPQQQQSDKSTQNILQQDPDLYLKQGVDSANGKPVSSSHVEFKQKQQQHAAAPGCPPDWWGHKWFVSAGTLPGMEDEVVKGKVERQTFDEADQTALYMNTFDKQSKGKKGLGERKIKIAGGNWEGTKVRFDDADEGTLKEQSAPPVGVSSESPMDTDERPSHPSSSDDPAQPAQEPTSIPWVKLAKRCLKKAPGQQLKWKALWSAVKERMKADGMEWSGGKEMLQKKVADSGRFVVEGKVVKLTA